jgi:hypothetical protein
MKRRVSRRSPSTAKRPIKYGDLAHLVDRVPEDLSLPQEVLDDFEQAIDKLERTLTAARKNNSDTEA